MKKLILLIFVFISVNMNAQIESRGFPSTTNRPIFKGFPANNPSDVNGVEGVPIEENIVLLVALGLGYAVIRGIKSYKHRKKYY
ncbi:MAG: hypothetical protein IKB57_04520 [Bacteroidaceae bacterium]|nr:hypothetical protein [Bacteroidaceae bacterium]